MNFLLVLDDNTTLARNQYIIDNEVFDQKVKELVLRYNYTLNPLGIYEAVKYMYTYWPDPNNVTYIRDQYINVMIFSNCKEYQRMCLWESRILKNVLLCFLATIRLPLCRTCGQNRKTSGGTERSSLHVRVEHDYRSIEISLVETSPS